MNPRIQRSMLILPVNVPRFVEKAYQRGADVIALDLEDAVPPAEKANARKLVKDAIVSAGRGGADVLVRINSDADMMDDDLDASIYPGLHGIFIPKVDSAEQVVSLESRIARLEEKRGLEPGSVKVSLHIESPLGVLRMPEIASAGTRTESMSIGVDDYCVHLGVEPSEEAAELLFPLSTLIVVCKAYGISPMGIFGTVAGFRDAEGFERAAHRGREMGCTGAFCIHPDQVQILNRVFSPPPARVEHARRVAAAFEEGLKSGRASVSLDNRMVDTPIYKQALLVLEQAKAVAELERRKAEALGRA